ncbi:MAG: C-terminal helicase domain-containing protein, partial [Sphingomonadales bacterium]
TFKYLKQNGYNVGQLHGDMDQSVRTETLRAFKDGEVTLLVASDVAARGLDIPEVSHVFNFDVPTHAEDYVHRIGRTGRAGRSGKSYTLARSGDRKYVDAIEKLIGTRIPVAEVPGVAAATPSDGDEKPARGRSRRGSDKSGPSSGKKSSSRTRASAKPESPSEKSSSVEAPPVVEKPEPEMVSETTVTPPVSEETAAEISDGGPHDADVVPAPAKGRSRRSEAGTSSRRSGGRSREDDSVVGMGDHVPAFLLRGLPRD